MASTNTLHKNEKNQCDISVIIPLAGKLHRERVKACVACLKKQNKINIEVIIVQPSNELNIEYINNDIIRVNVTPIYDKYPSIGRLRNEGVRHSSGKFLFLFDADILLDKDDYLYQLLELIESSNNQIFASPLRNRILDVKQNELIADILNYKSLEDVLEPIDKIDFAYLYKGYKQDIPEIEINSVRGYLHFALKSEIDKSIDKSHSFQSSVWKGNIWGGGLLVKREYFELVGGYCEKFVGWGPEDADLKRKLEYVAGIQLMFQDEKLKPFKVFHLEHDIPHRTEITLEQNKALREKRATIPLNDLIKEDLKFYQIGYQI